MQTQNVDPDSFPVVRCSGFSCRFLCMFLWLRFVVVLMLMCVLSLCCGGVAADVRYGFALLPLYGVRLVTDTACCWSRYCVLFCVLVLHLLLRFYTSRPCRFNAREHLGDAKVSYFVAALALRVLRSLANRAEQPRSLQRTATSKRIYSRSAPRPPAPRPSPTPPKLS